MSVACVCDAQSSGVASRPMTSSEREKERESVGGEERDRETTGEGSALSIPAMRVCFPFSLSHCHLPTNTKHCHCSMAISKCALA